MMYIDIVSYKPLSAAQAEFCCAELCKAVGADFSLDVPDDDGGWTWEGRHGSVGYDTDEHHYHCITISASPIADLPAITSIVCAMCKRGCIATISDELYPFTPQQRERQDYLENFDYRLQQI